jgi:hypothetical protein
LINDKKQQLERYFNFKTFSVWEVLVKKQVEIKDGSFKRMLFFFNTEIYGVHETLNTYLASRGYYQ